MFGIFPSNPMLLVEQIDILILKTILDQNIIFACPYEVQCTRVWFLPRAGLMSLILINYICRLNLPPGWL